MTEQETKGGRLLEGFGGLYVCVCGEEVVFNAVVVLSQRLV